MPDIPGLPGEVFFGDVDAPLPDWRKEHMDIEDDDAADRPDEKRQEVVANMLGFSPFTVESLAEPKK